jgi:hypothetical protein
MPTRTTPLGGLPLVGLLVTPVQRATKPESAESLHRVTLRNQADGPVLVSSDVRSSVRLIAVEPGGRGWIVEDLARPSAGRIETRSTPVFATGQHSRRNVPLTWSSAGM